MKTLAQQLYQNEEFKKIQDQFVQILRVQSQALRNSVGKIEYSDEEKAAQKKKYAETLALFQKNRGRELYYPYLSSGLGAGPFLQLEDGSIKMDLICGIGVNLFGHSHSQLIAETLKGAVSDPMQGNLQPGYEAAEIIDELLKHVGAKSRLKHAWLTCSGTMANEVALKIIRQKKFPATRVMAFFDCFAGRSTAMQEITDNAKYREGQPTYGEVAYIPFYDETLGLEKSIQNTLSRMQEHLSRAPGMFCALMGELVQGEGGINFAPKAYYEAIFSEARKANLAIWIDEIQTFGRTGELFAYQAFDLESAPDVVTVGKVLQACAAIYTEEFNPKPGLVAGTFTGSATALRSGRRVVEMLTQDGFLGKAGKINQLSRYFVSQLEKLKQGTCKGFIGELRAIGAMIAFKPYGGSADDCKRLLMHLFENDLIAFNCGHGPYYIRMLPPFGVMTESDVDWAIQKIEASLKACAPGVAT